MVYQWHQPIQWQLVSGKLLQWKLELDMRYPDQGIIENDSLLDWGVVKRVFSVVRHIKIEYKSPKENRKCK
jgi:hypothetical protein